MIQRYGHSLIRLEPVIGQPEWKRLTTDFRGLLHNKPISSASGDGRYKTRLLQLAGETGERDTHPHVDGDLIAFNGLDGWGGLSSDPAVIEREGIVGETLIIFTDHKPYDLYVCGLLLLLDVHAPATFEIASDGGAPEWNHARRWVKETLGHDRAPYWL